MGLSELSQLLKKHFDKSDLEPIVDILWKYSRPRAKPAPKALLFTINGLTYPIHKEYGVAGVPFPSEVVRGRFNTQRSKRTYSMLAGLLSVRKGDLLFFFQADPQYPQTLENRRGFRGIWAIASEPFMDVTSLSTRLGYEILGACPNCGVPFDFGGGEEAFTRGGERRCLWCDSSFGSVKLGTQKFSKVLISLRVLIEPVIVFRRTSGDNRVYTDMGTSPLVWVSRSDNAMGPGKGSSIRILLPEEMAKIGYMLASEDDQALDNVGSSNYPGRPQRITDYNGEPIEHLRSTDGNTLQHELMMNLYFAMNIDRPGHPLVNLLNIKLEEVEYWTSEFPWGYTGDQADFVLTLWRDGIGRHTIYIFEFKRNRVDVEALAETLLYVPWVSQVLTQFRAETREVHVKPVLVGHSFKLKYLPEEYSISIKTITGLKKLNVETPILLKYSLSNVYTVRDKLTRGDIYYAKDLRFDLIKLRTLKIKPPPPTYTTTGIERKYVAERYLGPLSG